MAKRSVADRVMSGLKQARDHAAGKDVPGLIEHIPEEIDVAAIRKKTNLSQVEFAEMIAVKLPTLRNWEQGRRQPEGPARVLLSMVSRQPRIVLTTLGAVLDKPSRNRPSPAEADHNRRRMKQAMAGEGRSALRKPG